MPAPESTVLFRCGAAALDRSRLRRFAAVLRDEVAGGRSFTCLIARDREMQRLNAQFLGKDYPTDVLSFPSGGRDGFLGEIAISLDRAEEQAPEYGHSVEDELCILMLHGVLHLMGLDHERDRGRMRGVEARWRKALKLPAGLIERTRA
jgi:probable rRNA maturation factor